MCVCIYIYADKANSPLLRQTLSDLATDKQTGIYIYIYIYIYINNRRYFGRLSATSRPTSRLVRLCIYMCLCILCMSISVYPFALTTLLADKATFPLLLQARSGLATHRQTGISISISIYQLYM